MSRSLGVSWLLLLLLGPHFKLSTDGSQLAELSLPLVVTSLVHTRNVYLS